VDNCGCYPIPMSGFFAPLVRLLAAFSIVLSMPAAAQEDGRWSIAIHGGAGTIARDNMTPEQDAAYREALRKALDAGAKVLREGGTAMDAIMRVVYDIGLENKVQVFQFSAECFSSKSKSH